MQMVAWIGVLSFGWLAVFQVLLAAGLPLGHMAWGGANRVLPTGQRVASLVSAILAVLALCAVAQAGALFALLPAPWVTPMLWAFGTLFGLSALLNLLGARGLERLHGVPLAVLCAGSAFALALQ